MLGPKTKESFEMVKGYVCDLYPEFEDVMLQHCGKAEADHKRKKRWYAHTNHVADVICICRAFENLGDEQRAGILMHEFGHLFCERFPRLYPKNNDDNADAACENEFNIPIYYDDDDLEVVDLPLVAEDADYGDEDDADMADRLDQGFFDPRPGEIKERRSPADEEREGRDIGIY